MRTLSDLLSLAIGIGIDNMAGTDGNHGVILSVSVDPGQLTYF